MTAHNLTQATYPSWAFVSTLVPHWYLTITHTYTPKRTPPHRHSIEIFRILVHFDTNSGRHELIALDTRINWVLLSLPISLTFQLQSGAVPKQRQPTESPSSLNLPSVHITATVNPFNALQFWSQSGVLIVTLKIFSILSVFPSVVSKSIQTWLIGLSRISKVTLKFFSNSLEQIFLHF